MKELRILVLKLLIQTGELSPENLFNQCLMLLGKTTAANSLRYYNQAGYSKDRLEAIVYDLKKAVGVKDSDVVNFMAEQEKAAEKDAKVKSLKPEGDPDGVTDADPDGEEAGKPEGDPDADPDGEGAGDPEGVDPEATEKSELEKDLEKQGDDVKSGFKLIALYPFLDDPDCPDELKILVSDMMAAYRGFAAGHEGLSKLLENFKQDPATNQELYEIGGELIAKWELNEQIHAELKHYAEHKEVLGKHPKLVNLALEQEIDKMTEKKAKSRLKQVKTNVSNNTVKLKSAKDDKKKAEIQSRVDHYTMEQELLEARIKKLESASE